MRKYIILAAASLLLCAGSAALWAHVSSDEFLNANAEALIETRSLPDRTVDCFSQSEYNEGHTYWDCGNCKRYEHQKGVGNMRTCQPDENEA